MEKRIVFYWQKLSRKYSSNQIYFILTYWTFAVYTQILWEKSEPERLEEWKNFLSSLFSECVDYDVKEAAVRLSDRIEWSLLIQDQTAKNILNEYAENVERWLRGREREKRSCGIQERLCNLMEALFDVAAIHSSYLTTPKSIREIVGNLLIEKHIGSMADICCGSGAFGLAVWRKLSDRENISYCGMDMEPVVCDINRLMTYLCGVNKSEAVREDILESRITESVKKFDLVLLDVPRGRNKNISTAEYGDWLMQNSQKTVFADWIYILKALDVMDEKGKGIVIATSGSLARKNESMLRKKVIENDWIEAVITLPANLYPNTRTGSEMIIFNKNKAGKKAGKILFVDISQYYYRDNRNYYSVSKQGLDLIRQAYREYCRISGISSVIPISEIDENVWSLKPMRYIERQEEQNRAFSLSLQDIAQITRGVQLKKEEEERLGQQGTALFLNIKDIQNGEIHYEEANKISPKNFEWHEKFQIRENDIIITSKGTNFKIAIVGENPPEAYICGNLTLLRVDRNVYHPYVLLEYLTSAMGMRALESIQSGTTIRILNNANLGNLQIPSYRQEVMNTVGEHLKSKRQNYMQQMKEITEQYTMERKVLLERLKINE